MDTITLLVNRVLAYNIEFICKSHGYTVSVANQSIIISYCGEVIFKEDILDSFIHPEYECQITCILNKIYEAMVNTIA